MRLSKALLVFRKDWREVGRNWEVLTPIALVPLLFSVVLPLIVISVPGQVNTGTSPEVLIESIMRGAPASVMEMLAGFTEDQQLTYVLFVYMFAPFFLLIPVMASSVIASDSFAGEKERKTIEALLATPLTDGELLFGKMLVSFVPAMAITILSFIAYTVVVDVGTYGLFGALLLPTLEWFLLIFLMTPALSLAAIGLTVLISSRVKGFKEAQQISVVLVIPIIGLFIGQGTGALTLGPPVILALTALLAFFDLLIFRFSVLLFKREKVLTTWK
ncbi:ABC transporter permease [Candidatus Bathyarchaeota archaeon]|nr:ABC transporter permease [Candidatus Bathyarchaeota archaeon]MBL7167840.1 ABC transporter permease [Candidatus Bathyarchaeota archaeon]